MNVLELKIYTLDQLKKRNRLKERRKKKKKDKKEKEKTN